MYLDPDYIALASRDITDPGKTSTTPTVPSCSTEKRDASDCLYCKRVVKFVVQDLDSDRTVGDTEEALKRSARGSRHAFATVVLFS